MPQQNNRRYGNRSDSARYADRSRGSVQQRSWSAQQRSQRAQASGRRPAAQQYPRSSYAAHSLSQRRQPPRWPLVLIVAALVIIFAVTFFACHSGGSQDQAQDTQATQQEQVEQSTSTQEQQSSTEAEQTQAASDNELSPLRTEEERKATSTSDNKEKPGKKVCYLTFDDGPSTNTHKILKILDEYGVHATWFVIGTRGHLEYVKDIWDAGHQVALHSQTHEYDIDYANTTNYFKGLDKLAKQVKKYLGFEPTLFRFPGGSVNGYNRAVRSALKAEAKSRNWHYFDWNVGSGDAAGNNVPASKIMKNIKKESKGNNSSCVLMHDTEAKDTTVEALPKMIEYFKEEGYTFDVLTADSYGYQF